jgi:anti-sigma regulatory factor (Ser/Thr protein kinase)
MSHPTTTPTVRDCASEGYRHEALFYSGPDEFMAGTLSFLRDAVAGGEPTLVVLAAPKIEALREALNGDADQVIFADMSDVGTNPARIIPAWQQFVAEHSGKGRRLRGIGEPIWPERSPAELAECQRHEALLNVCFDDPDFWLLCPYDTTALHPEVIDEARRNHPIVSMRGVPEPSTSFPGVEALAAPFEEPLPDPPADAALMYFERTALHGVREFVADHASRSGLDADAVADLVLTVHELATNTLAHGGGEGTVCIWDEPGAVVCEIRDRGRIVDPLAGRIQPSMDLPGGRGLWLANQLCELVQIRPFQDGGTVRVHKRLG